MRLQEVTGGYHPTSEQNGQAAAWAFSSEAGGQRAKRSYRRLLVGAIVCVGVALPIFGFAEERDIPLQLAILGRGAVRDLADYVGIVYQYLVGVAGIMAVAMIMYGGMRWIFAAGDRGKISAAKEIISHAIIGFVLALGSFVILNTINPALVNFRVPAITPINPIGLVNNAACPNVGPAVGRYACGQPATITGQEAAEVRFTGQCIGSACPSGGVCGQRMSENPQQIAQFTCVLPGACGSRCESIQSEDYCLHSVCWSIAHSTCYWDGSCRTGKPASTECDEDIECISRICNKGYFFEGLGGTFGNQCAPIGGSDIGQPCDRDLDCGCVDLTQAGHPTQCPKLCNRAEGVDKCIAARSLAAGEDCNTDQQCQSGNCSIIGSVATGAITGAAVGGGVGFVKGCLAYGAAGAGVGAFAGGVGAVPGAVIGCLGGGLLGAGIGATIGGAALGGVAGYAVLDGECR